MRASDLLRELIAPGAGFASAAKRGTPANPAISANTRASTGFSGLRPAANFANGGGPSPEKSQKSQAFANGKSEQRRGYSQDSQESQASPVLSAEDHAAVAERDRVLESQPSENRLPAPLPKLPKLPKPLLAVKTVPTLGDLRQQRIDRDRQLREAAIPFHLHLFGEARTTNCCNAHHGRYCPTGAALRAAYQQAAQ